MTLVARAGRRSLRRHPWQVGLSTLGIALGVAIVVAIAVANDSATRAFELSTEAVVGRTTHQVVGGPAGVPEDVYRRLRVELGVRPSAPVVEGQVLVPAAGVTRPRAFDLSILGLDPFAEGPFRGLLASRAGESRGGARGDDPLKPLLTRPGTVALPADTARALGVHVGDRLAVRALGRERTLEVAVVLEADTAGARAALADVALADVAAAQEILGLVGRLSRIDLIAPPGDEAGWERRVRAALPAGVELVPAGARTRAMAGMTRAFRLNLTALSLLSLLCGVFLIYNTMTFSVVQRRPLIGLLRATGVTRAEIFRVVLGEAAVIGGVGTAFGLALGVGLAGALLRLVTRTINDLYFTLRVEQVTVSPWTLALGAALGVGATVFAALPPAFEATLAPPRATLTRSVIEERTRKAIPRAAALGVALLVLGVLGLAWPSRSLVLAFAGLFGVLVGCAMLVPLAVVGLMRVVAPALGRAFGTLGRFAARGVSASLSRTAVAIAALMVAVSVIIGVGVMIGSFRETVVRWLDATLASDVYVSARSPRAARSDPPLDPAAIERVRRVPGAVAMNTLHGVSLETPDGPLRVLAVGFDPRAPRPFQLEEGDPRTAWPAFDRGAVMVSEPYAFRHRTRPGDTIALPGPAGPVRVRVAGVFASYGSDQGVVLVARATFAALWHDDAISALGVFAAPGTDPARFAGAVRAAAGPGLSVQSNREIRRVSLEIFDRTFTITSVLRLLVAAVAFLGVLTALMALQLERAREFAVLRAGGLLPRQVWQLVTMQTALMGLAAGLLAWPVGIAQAAAMVYVINRRSFGWTLPLSVEAPVLLQALAIAVVAALLAGIGPAWRMARTDPAMALHEE